MNYTDVVTYCSNTADLVQELSENFPEYLDNTDENNPKFLITKVTITVRSGDETLSYCRLLNQQEIDMINSLSSLEILGDYDEVFADPAKKTIYDRVYDQTPMDITLEDGSTTTYTPPQKFCVFAS